jgi:hypothetical protein
LKFIVRFWNAHRLDCRFLNPKVRVVGLGDLLEIVSMPLILPIPLHAHIANTWHQLVLFEVARLIINIGSRKSERRLAVPRARTSSHQTPDGTA